MKSSKRILVLLVALLLMSAIAGILSIPAIIFHYSFYWSFAFFFGIQPILKALYDNYIEVNILADYKTKMLEKPFREDIVPFNCQACGTIHEVPYNIHVMDFRCLKCKRLNNINLTFQTTIANEMIK